MKKYIYIIFFIVILLVLLILPIRITPKNYYHLSKEQRQEVIKKLSKKCLINDDTFGLIVTYNEVLHDKNASRCWKNYFEKCIYNKENNLTLALPIKCPTY